MMPKTARLANLEKPARTWEAQYENLSQALRFFGTATGRGDVRTLEGATVIFSGLEYGVFNIALLRTPIEDAAAAVAACEEFFSKRARRWSMWICEDALPKPGLRDLQLALKRQQLEEISRAPGMELTKFNRPRRELPVIRSVAVDTQVLRDTFGGLAGVCFDIPAGVAREVYGPERAWQKGPEAYRGYVGMVAGRPVGICAMVRTGSTLGVYSLGIDPESRGLGYGEALLRNTVAIEEARGGVERILLQSSESGNSLYRSLGFKETSQFSVHLKR
jgi:ribosomal protein S18 acetylase RimI-like enzyme